MSSTLNLLLLPPLYWGGSHRGPQAGAPPSQALREGLQPPPLPVPMSLPLPFLPVAGTQISGHLLWARHCTTAPLGTPRRLLPPLGKQPSFTMQFSAKRLIETSSHHRVSRARTAPRFSLESLDAWVLKGGGRLWASKARDGGGAPAGGRPISQLSAPWEGGGCTAAGGGEAK